MGFWTLVGHVDWAFLGGFRIVAQVVFDFASGYLQIFVVWLVIS